MENTVKKLDTRSYKNEYGLVTIIGDGKKRNYFGIMSFIFNDSIYKVKAFVQCTEDDTFNYEKGFKILENKLIKNYLGFMIHKAYDKKFFVEKTLRTLERDIAYLEKQHRKYEYLYKKEGLKEEKREEVSKTEDKEVDSKTENNEAKTVDKQEK